MRNDSVTGSIGLCLLSSTLLAAAHSSPGRTLDVDETRMQVTWLPSFSIRKSCKWFFKPSGATFNLAHSFSQMLHLLPQNRFEEFDRRHFPGARTRPGSGLSVIFESARLSTRLLLEDLGVAA